jgi:hypothetical protein
LRTARWQLDKTGRDRQLDLETTELYHKLIELRFQDFHGGLKTMKNPGHWPVKVLEILLPTWRGSSNRQTFANRQRLLNGFGRSILLLNFVSQCPIVIIAHGKNTLETLIFVFNLAVSTNSGSGQNVSLVENTAIS